MENKEIKEELSNEEELIEYCISVDNYYSTDSPKEYYDEDAEDILNSGYKAYKINLVKRAEDFFILSGTRENIKEYLNELGFEFDENNAETIFKDNLNEELDSKANALADYLDIDEDDIEQGNVEYIYNTPRGQYIVCDSDKARELAEEDIESIFDDIGLEAFTPSFQQWILDYALNENLVEDMQRDHYKFYIEDIEEEDSDEFENRLIEEMFEEGVLSDKDFEEDEDGEVNYKELKEDVSIYDLKKTFLESIMEDELPGDYLVNTYGDGRDLSNLIKEKDYLIDLDKVIDACIDEDGIAHFISSNGDEIELGDDLFAYRIS